MRRAVNQWCVLFALLLLAVAPAMAQTSWRNKVERALPLMGHRNWILIVDSAYPLQASAGVETIETGADQVEVTRFVLDAIQHSIAVRPDILMDAELPFVPESDAPGVTAYRAAIGKLLARIPVESVPHEQLIGRVDEAGRTMHVLVLKTTMTVPYSSVFVRLNCKYWSDDAEARLRRKMADAKR